jgi:hypothetical protein
MSPMPPPLWSEATCSFPNLSFAAERHEHPIFRPAILSSSNTSFDPATAWVGGTTLAGVPLEQRRALMRRFREGTALVGQLFPSYYLRVLD